MEMLPSLDNDFEFQVTKLHRLVVDAKGQAVNVQRDIHIGYIRVRFFQVSCMNTANIHKGKFAKDQEWLSTPNDRELIVYFKPYPVSLIL